METKNGTLPVLEEWMAKASVMELLSMGLLLPTRVLADALSSGEYQEACEEAFQILEMDTPKSIESLSAYVDANTEQLFHELRKEYTTLFSKAPAPDVMPYIGVWAEQKEGRDGLLFVSKKSMAIERFMRACGVAKNHDTEVSNDPLDHIGSVCEFMKYLCLVHAQAIAVPDGAQVADDAFRVFHAEHFKEYALWCSHEVCECKPNAFYIFMADVIECIALDF